MRLIYGGGGFIGWGTRSRVDTYVINNIRDLVLIPSVIKNIRDLVLILM
jgi:hypothetical protein